MPSGGLEPPSTRPCTNGTSGLDAASRAQAARLSKPAPEDLSHGLIFFTVGEAVRRAVPSQVPYAGTFGIWQRRRARTQPGAARRDAQRMRRSEESGRQTIRGSVTRASSSSVTRSPNGAL